MVKVTGRDWPKLSDIAISRNLWSNPPKKGNSWKAFKVADLECDSSGFLWGRKESRACWRRSLMVLCPSRAWRIWWQVWWLFMCGWWLLYCDYIYCDYKWSQTHISPDLAPKFPSLALDERTFVSLPKDSVARIWLEANCGHGHLLIIYCGIKSKMCPLSAQKFNSELVYSVLQNSRVRGCSNTDGLHVRISQKVALRQ